MTNAYYRWLGFALFSLTASVDIGEAAEFKIGVRAEEIAEVGTVNHTTLSTLISEFSFLPPPGWTREIDVKAGTVALTSPDFRSAIRLLLPSAESDAVAALNPDELRQAAVVDRVEFKIVEESQCYTAGLKGLAIDVEHVLENKLRVRTREAFLPAPGGLVRITLSAPAEQFTVRQADLSRFLNSFRVLRRDSSVAGVDAAKH